MSNSFNFDEIISNGKTNIAVDISWVMYKSFYVFTPDKFRTTQGLPNGHLFGLVQLLRTLTMRGCNVFLCEEGKYNYRKTLLEDYKANRNPSENNTEFWREYPNIHKLVSNLDNVYCLHNDNFESDDILYSVAKRCSDKGISCFIHTADKDLFQALDGNIGILKKITLKSSEEIHYDSQEYTDKFPVEPWKLPYYRAFKGDVSDNIEPLVKRLPKALILDLVDYLYENKSLKGYVVKTPSHNKWLKQVLDNWDTYLNNYKVMKLSIIPFEILDREPRDSYKEICDKYELTQFKYFVGTQSI